jgi:hypothetical protein
MPGRYLRIARVLHQDDDLVTLEVVKNERRQLRIEDGDQFWTLVFLRQERGAAMTFWLPWEHR